MNSTELKKSSGRVVVTGYGGVTPIGNSWDCFWSNLIAGKSGAAIVKAFDASEYSTYIAGEVKDFNPEDWLDKKDARRVSRFISFAIAAAQKALERSNLNSKEYGEHIGAVIGSGIGNLEILREQHSRLLELGPSKVSPFLVPFMIPNMAAGYVSIVNGLKGPTSCIATACTTGTNSIGEAYHMIKRGEAIAMLAGGTETPINPISMAGFCSAKAMTRNNDHPEQASRPFDKNRDGFLIGEGAAVLVLEDYAFAKERGAAILAEIVGYGVSSDAYHLTQPDPEANGATKCMQNALKSAGIKPEQISYINAHGTSTYLNDKTETTAIKRVFGENAYRIPASSTKSMIGHLLGAAGAVEAMICVQAIENNIIPPTINYENPDPECDLDYVPNQARHINVEFALSNSFGFGGHNGTLIFKRCQ